MAFTPPSTVGDIIAIVTLAVQIGQALSDSRGASKDYRVLIDELAAFRRALRVLEYKIRHHPPGEGVVQDILKEASTCRRFMEEFLKSIEGYQVLSQKGRNSIWRKIVWSIFKTREVGNFRQQLSSRQATINLYLTIEIM